MRRPAVVLVLPFAIAAAACGQVAEARHGTTLPRTGVAAVGTASRLGEPAGEGAVTYRITSIVKVKPTKGTKIELARVELPEARWPKVAPSNPLRLCPIAGPGSFSDDFGAPRYAGGYHPHAGNDMFAEAGTPIVAPFDGQAVPTPNTLGGLAVKVYGPLGYVYNAHLSAYGKVGRVRAGDVIGFVGNTGDAVGTPPHNHFEWHPGNGPAVNPFPYLVDACRGG